MTRRPDLASLVCCPVCQGALEVGDAAATCAACGMSYPIAAGVPWLYRDVDGSRAQWSAKQAHFRDGIAADLRALDAALGAPDLVPSTQERLARQKDGLRRFAGQVDGLLGSFALAASAPGAALPKDRIPGTQHVDSYLETVFRDWVWGEDEIREAMALAGPLGPPLEAGDAALVLGGGAGRFAAELARTYPDVDVVQLDLNPLLSAIGQRVTAGESVELVELPRFPLSVEDAVAPQTLALAEPPERAPLFLVGDAFAPPFADESFARLYTPWFVDIVPERFPDLSRRLARCLAPEGVWISFGPLSFESQGPADRLTPEEVVDVLEAQGFEVLAAGTETVAYLHSPHGMPRRGEEVFAFAARRPAQLVPVDDFAYYPEWLTDARKPIPADPRFDTLRAERTFDVEILKCIDGRASIEDLEVILSSRFGLPSAECRRTIERFFARWFEER